MTDANKTLTTANEAADEARQMFIVLSGGSLTATRDVICPAVSKLYFVQNNTTGGQSIRFKTVAGTGITIPNGARAILYCDGTNVTTAAGLAPLPAAGTSTEMLQNLGALAADTQAKTGAYTVVAADNGTQFHAVTANATFTLPALVPGLSFDFVRASGHNLVIASAAGDDIIVGNDLSADSITFSTANNLIGARVKVESMYVNGTLKWLAEIVPAPFSTGAFLTQTLAT
jgi:hypothetical protein